MFCTRLKKKRKDDVNDVDDDDDDDDKCDIDVIDRRTDQTGRVTFLVYEIERIRKITVRTGNVHRNDRQ